MNLQSVVVLLLLAFVQVNGITSTCGEQLLSHKKLMKGSFLADHWPWHAAIFRNNEYICGGTVISSNSILTAAHCATKSNSNVQVNKEIVSVYLGMIQLNVTDNNSQSFNISKIFLHPNYNTVDSKNDIAILKLSKNATFNNYVQPVCLWNENKTNVSEVHGKSGTVVGWGGTETSEVSNELLEALMPVVSYDDCLPTNRDLISRFFSPTKFCAGSRNGTSICTGDSGGSMTFKMENLHYIRGIVSIAPQMENKTANKNECDPTHYALFTDVAKYLTWIKTIVNECEKKVQCKFINFGKGLECETLLNIKRSEPNCHIIFNESTTANVITLNINGESEVLPDLSDAIDKFKNLITLDLRRLKLQIVENGNFAPFSRIKTLNLQQNNISDLASNTFNSLSDLLELALDYNNLKAIPGDLFQKLQNLTKLNLNNNQLKELPEDLFRNNHKLEFLFCYDNHISELHRDVFLNLTNLKEIYLHKNNLTVLEEGLFRNNPSLNTIWLQFNQIKHIRCDFYDLPELINIDLRDNPCIDEDCVVKSFCETTSIIQMQRKIWNKCPF